MNNCKVCKKETKNKVYCSVICQYEGYREKKSDRIKANCIFCNNEFQDTEYRINTIGKKYCSRSCKDTHQKEIYQRDGNPVYGREHSEEWKKWQSHRFTELWKSDEHRKKVKDGQKKFKEDNGYWCGTDENSKHKRKTTNLKKYGVDHGWKNKKIREKCEITNIERYGKISVEIAFEGFKKKGLTSIEKKIKEILEVNKVNFEIYFYVYFDVNKYKIYDFYLPKYNLLIEADGDYWHGNPKKFSQLNEKQQTNVDNDKFKDELAKENGYKLIRFWEEEIKEKDFEKKLLQNIKQYEK